MRSRPGPARFTWRIAVVLVALAGMGCREELGPVRAPATQVVGRVRIGDRPLGGGWIEFLPIDGTVGYLRGAPIEAGGRFRAEDVPVGRVGIRLVGFPPIDPGDPRVGVFLGQVRQVYLIHREIPAGAPAELDIDLVVEAYRMLDGKS